MSYRTLENINSRNYTNTETGYRTLGNMSNNSHTNTNRLETLEYIENSLPGTSDMSGCYHNWIVLLENEYTERAYCQQCLLYRRRSLFKIGGTIYRQLDEDILLKLE